ncbi:DUF4129 domain-containing protein [Taibaiella koreensis]|uniref:DUF4129 domain-containing protein n=1 Tax=Taibaiella koreensis TaxID=1268548 RepID=UPI000E59B116|nr:DUF4129 domain-containing protein [Taibaiella koreensis]
MYPRRKPLYLLLLLLCLQPCSSLTAQDSSGAKSYQDYENQSYDQNAASASATETQEPDSIQYAAPAPVATDDNHYTDEPPPEEKTSYTVFSELRQPLPWQRRAINEQKWQQLTQDKDFRYSDPETKPKEQARTNDSWWFRFFESLFRFLSSGAGKVLIICLVALIVIVIVIRVIQLKGNIFFAPKDKKVPQDADNELADDYVPLSWEQAIQDAAAAGNYRLAVRHSYRYLLHLLQEKELIAFQTAKTNYQYAYELSGTRLHRPFLQLTRGYEYAWYGGLPVAKDRFEAYYQEINGLKKDLHP